MGNYQSGRLQYLHSVIISAIGKQHRATCLAACLLRVCVCGLQGAGCCLPTRPPGHANAEMLACWHSPPDRSLRPRLVQLRPARDCGQTQAGWIRGGSAGGRHPAGGRTGGGAEPRRMAPPSAARVGLQSHGEKQGRGVRRALRSQIACLSPLSSLGWAEESEATIFGPTA
jgi:hypothetical protein